MSVESPFRNREDQIEAHAKKEWTFLDAIKGVRTVAHHLLESVPEPLIGGKNLMVKVPRSRRIFRIAEYRKIDPSKNEKVSDLETEITVVSFRRPLIQKKPLDSVYQVTFPPLVPDINNIVPSTYRSAKHFSKFELRKLERQLKKAVPMK